MFYEALMGMHRISFESIPSPETKKSLKRRADIYSVEAYYPVVHDRLAVPRH